MARLGLEPRVSRLTCEHSTTELPSHTIDRLHGSALTSRCALCHVSMESFFLIGLASRIKVRANELAECVNLTEIMDFKQKSRDFSYEHHGEKI